MKRKKYVAPQVRTIELTNGQELLQVGSPSEADVQSEGFEGFDEI